MLGQGFLGLLSLRHIDAHSGDELPAFAVGHGKFEDQPVMQRTIDCRDLFEDFLGTARAQNLHVIFMRCFGGTLREPVKACLASQKCKLFSENSFERFVYVDVASFVVLHERHRWAVVHKAMEEFLAFAQCLL